jgi:PAS domain S-box-containing protein
MTQQIVQARHGPATGPTGGPLSGTPQPFGGRLYLIGDVAALTGLTTHALRAWEHVGLLAPRRTAGGVRQYTEDDLARIRLISRTLDTMRLSRRTVATLLRSGELRPDAADYAPGPVGSRRSKARANGMRSADGARATSPLPGAVGQERRLLDAVARVGNAVASGRPLPEVLTVVCRETCDALAVSDAVLWLLDSPPGAPVGPTGAAPAASRASALAAAAAYGPHAEPTLRAGQSTRIPLDHPRFAAAQALRVRRGVIVNAIDTSPVAHSELRILLPAAAMLVVPLFASAGEAVGALTLREALDPERFDDDDLERAQLFATQAAIAIETARLHEGIQAAREQAEAERARWQASMDNAPELVATCDPTARITYINPTYERLTGVPVDLALPIEAQPTYYGLLTPDGLGLCAPNTLPFQRALREGQPVRNIEVLQRAADGTVRLVVWDAAPVYAPQGELLGAVALGRDVSEDRRRIQRERCLAAVTRAALSAPGPAEIEGRASRVLAALVEHAELPLVAASLHLLDPVSGAFRPVGVFGASQTSNISAGVPLQSRLLGWRALTTGPQYAAGGEESLAWLDAAGRRAWHVAGFRSWAAVPLRAGDETFGALSVGLGQPHLWDAAERTWFEACANAIALAVQNDRLFAAERRRTQELEAVLEGVDAGVTLTGADGRAIVRNKFAVQLTGRPEVQGTLTQNAASYGLLDAESGARVPAEQTPVGRALHGERVRDMRLLMRDTTGRDRVMLSSSNPVRDATGRVVAAVTTFRDVTAETRRAQLFKWMGHVLGASLDPAAEMQAMADALVANGSGDAVAVYERAPDGRNLHLLAACNYPRTVLPLVKRIPLHAQTIAALAVRTAEPQVIQRWAELHSPEHELTRRLAERLDAESGVALPLLARGRVVGALVVSARQPNRYPPEEVAVLLDLGGRAGLALDNARLYEAAHRTAAELSAIIDAMAEGVRVCDATGQITRVNRAGAAFLGVSAEETLQSLAEYVEANAPRWPDGRPMLATEIPLARALHGETDSDFELVQRHVATGQDLWLRSSYAPIRDETTDAIVGAVAVARDMTQVKALERAREELLAVVAHELKTPLTSLLGFLQAARRKHTNSARRALASGMDATVATSWSQEVEELLGRVERQAQRLDRLVNELLDLTRVQQGRLEYRWALGDLAGAVAEAVDGQRASHPERHIELTTPEEPLMVRLDADRIGQVVANFVSNALKYSRDERPVTIAVGAHADGTGAALEAMVQVRDEGPGIPPEYQEHLFERFYRVPGLEVQSGSGIGLGVGLYVAQAIVERHGGRIWVDSEPGHGSTFAFTVPLADGT